MMAVVLPKNKNTLIMSYGFCNNEREHKREGREDFERHGRYGYDHWKYDDHFNDCNRAYTDGFNEARQEEDRRQERYEEERREEERQMKQARERREQQEAEEEAYYDSVYEQQQYPEPERPYDNLPEAD